MFEKNIILDTCALIWLSNGDNRISDKTKSAIENSPIVFVSPISAWEISLKVERGVLQLPMKTEVWIQKVIDHHALTVTPLDITVLVTANQLPWHHKDPADRFIIASAIKENAVIVTADEKFQNYDIRIML